MPCYHVIHLQTTFWMYYVDTYLADVSQANLYCLIYPPLALFLGHIYNGCSTKYWIRDGNYFSCKGSKRGSGPANVDHNTFNQLAITVELNLVAHSEGILRHQQKTRSHANNNYREYDILVIINTSLLE